jgi:hypothetical protein
MNGLYLGEFYGSAYRQQKINGMVLDTAANVAKLVQWGISNEAHAENIWERLQTWKKYGVQRNLFDALEDSFQTLEVSSANQVPEYLNVFLSANHDNDLVLCLQL